MPKPEPGPPTRLMPKEISEISLCAKGANPESNVVIFKRDSSASEAGSDDVEKADSSDGMSCAECGAAVDDKFGLNRHMAKEHPEKSAIVKAATKTENGQSFPKAAYAYTPSDQPSDWKIRLWQSPTEKETPGQVGAAVAAIGKGFRGNKADIPPDAMASVKAKVRSAWKKVNSDKDASDMPPVLKSALPLGMRVIAKFTGTDTEDLRKSFEAEEEAQAVEDIEKDQLVYIDDDDDLVSDLRQLIGVDPPEDGEEDEDDGYVNVSGPLPKEQLAGALMALGKIEKAGKKMSTSRLNRLKDAHYALGGLISEVDESPDEKQGDPAPANAPAKPAPNDAPEQKETKKVTKIDKSELSPEVLEYIESLEKKAGDAETSSANEPEDVFKNLDPKAAEIMKSEIAKREALEVEVTKMRQEREWAEAIEKADFRYLPGPVEDRAELYLSTKQNSGEEAADKLLSTWAAGDSVIAEGNFFGEIGKTNSGPSGSTALDELNAAGAEIRKSNVDLSAEQAFVKAVEQNPELHRQYEAEQNRRLLSGV